MEMTNDLVNFGCTLIGEARGEPIQSIVGVASVIRNRYQLRYRGAKNYSDVCLSPSQFSCWNSSDPNYGLLKKLSKDTLAGVGLIDIAYRQCFIVAQAMMSWDFKDNTKGSTHYLTTYLYNGMNCPNWAKAGKVMAVLGDHTFLLVP